VVNPSSHNNGVNKAKDLSEKDNLFCHFCTHSIHLDAPFLSGQKNTLQQKTSRCENGDARGKDSDAAKSF
jgi:hypothetical protein